MVLRLSGFREKMMTKMIQAAVLGAGFAVSMLLAGGAQALTVGDIQIKSGLGQRFDASIPVTLAAGEDILPSCVRLEDLVATTNYKDVPALTRYDMRIERSGKNAVIRISSSVPISEPLMRVGLVIRCGAKVSTSREYMVTQTLSPSIQK